jgi:histidinol-phosphate aminotransferase
MPKINSFSQFVLQHSPKGYVPMHTSAIADFSNLVNVLGCSPRLQKTIKDLDFTSINEYGDRSGLLLKEKIARWLHVSPEQITIGNGSDEIIDRIPRIFLDPNEKALMQTPTFFRFFEACHKMKGKVMTINTKESEKFIFTQDFCNQMIQTIKKHNPKIIWLCSPCNPTGVVMPKEVLEIILSSTHGLVVIDEVYQELFDPENARSAIHMIKKHPNILVLKSFSKAFGLAGIRVGFAIADKTIIESLEEFRFNFPISILSQKIAELALDHTDFLSQCSRFFSNERNWLFEKIQSIPHLVIGADSQVNVFILKHTHKDLFQLLTKHRISTADFRNAIGLEAKGFVRITIKTREENSKLIDALQKIS